MKKRIFSWFLMLVMVLGMMPMTALAEEQTTVPYTVGTEEQDLVSLLEEEGEGYCKRADSDRQKRRVLGFAGGQWYRQNHFFEIAVRFAEILSGGTQDQWGCWRSAPKPPDVIREKNGER